MKLGAENRRTVGIMLVLLVVALFTTARAVFGGHSTAPVAATAGTKAGGRPAESRPFRVLRKVWTPPLVASDDPTLRFDLLKASEGREMDSGKVNIFQGKVEIPVPVDPGGIKPGSDKPPLPVVVPPPPINLKFYGFASKPGEKKKIFLSSGDDVFIGSEGDIINRRYKIVKITNTSVDIEDILNNNKQTIPLTSG